MIKPYICKEHQVEWSSFLMYV